MASVLVENDVMTTEETAAFLKIPLSSLYTISQQGKLPAAKVGRHWRYSRRMLESWLSTQMKSHYVTR